MAEQPDPRLEARLRDALHAEADAMPFKLRACEIERLAALRQRSRRSERMAVLAMAAVVVAAVVGVGAVSTLRGPQTGAPSKLTTLASFDQLLALGHGSPELGRHEGEATTLDGQWQLGVPQGTRLVEAVIVCSGPNAAVSAWGDLPQPNPDVEVVCDGQPVDLRDLGGGTLASAASPSVAVQIKAGTAFRMVVFDEAGASPDPIAYAAPTPDANGLATYDALTQRLEFDGDVKVATQGEHTTGGTGVEPEIWDVGAIDGMQGSIAFTCFGQSIKVGFGDGKQFVSAMEESCDPIIRVTSMPADLGTGATPHLMVEALPSVRWRVVAGVVPTTPGPTGSPEPSPSPAESAVPGMSLEYTMASGVTIPMRLADPSPTHATIRLATAAERKLGEAALAGGDSSLVPILPRSLLLTWVGTICETGYTLGVNGTQGGIGIFGDPRPGCDLGRVVFAAVLTWTRPVDLNGFGIQLQPPVLTNN